MRMRAASVPSAKPTRPLPQPEDPLLWSHPPHPWGAPQGPEWPPEATDSSNPTHLPRLPSTGRPPPSPSREHSPAAPGHPSFCRRARSFSHFRKTSHLDTNPAPAHVGLIPPAAAKPQNPLRGPVPLTLTGTTTALRGSADLRRAPWLEPAATPRPRRRSEGSLLSGAASTPRHKMRRTETACTSLSMARTAKGRRYSEGKDCFSRLPLPLAFNMHHYFGQKRLLGVGNKEEEERHQYHERKTDPSPQTISLAPAFLARPHSGIGGPGPGAGPHPSYSPVCLLSSSEIAPLFSQRVWGPPPTADPDGGGAVVRRWTWFTL